MPACKQCTRTFTKVNAKGMCSECAGEIVTYETATIRVVADARTGAVKRVERKNREDA